jgi:peptide/nickel transport system permease protein
MRIEKKTIKKYFKNPLNFIGTLILLLLVFVAIFAPLLAKSDPLAIVTANKLLPPSPVNPMGTDELGRDIFSRVVYGARISLMVGFEVVFSAVLIGVTLGGIAGFFGGWIDEIIMRITDMFLAFPSLILAMAVAAALGPDLKNAVLAISLTWWPWYTRLVRSQVLTLKQSQYVEAAKATGNKTFKIIANSIQ